MAVKVFCSHRGVDKPQVEAFARRLRGSGIDAWFDKWEIAPGDDIVARMNAGLDENEVGLVFFSNKEHNGPWFRAEVATLTFEMIENGKRLIPVMIDADAPLPPFLRPRARRGIDEFDAIVDAIKGIQRKPPLGPETPATAVHRFVVQLDTAKTAAGCIDVVARLDDIEVGRSQSLPLPRAAGLNFAEFLHGGFAEAFRSPADAARQSLEHALAQLGDALGSLLFAGPVGSALDKAIAEFTRVGHELELIFEAASPALLGLPFEAARLPDGRTPALLPAVSVLRRVAGAQAAYRPPLAGPLKILAAVGAPDESQTHNALLDLEHELQGILDALEKAAEHGNAQVRILEIGHPDAIRDALAADQYHVLHLSCHGSPGQIELEDEDGAPVPVSAADFADTLRAARHPLPLVFLATCHGGSPAGEAGSFAQALVQAGVPEVLAMQTQVSDRYASELAAAFYGQLNTPDRPAAGPALAHARQTLETARRRQSSPPRPEYATATLFVAGTENPLLDRSQAQAPLARTPVHHTDAAGLPRLKVGELIGRRPELRLALAILRDKPEALARYGQRAGIVLQGMGGVGKSALAGRIMARLNEEGWTCVAIAGAFNIDTLARALGLPTGDDTTRLQAIRQRLQREKLLLVLDNFETNLTVGGAAWRDDMVGEWLGYLCQSAGKGRLLLTSRHRPPGHDAWLETLPLPPLSAAETRKLILRLPQLAGSKGDDLRAILQRIGGHPRMLEYLDAVLHRGASRLTEIRQRLETQAKALGLNLKARPADLDEAIATSLRLGAHDILLAELLALASDQARAVLLQAAASNLPISAAGIAHALNDGPPSTAEIERVHLDLENLAELSLLVFVANDDVFVHRWTAECLLHAGPGQDESALRAIHARAGRYRLWRARNQSHALADGMEAVRNLLKAGEFDVATDEALAIVQVLIKAQQLAASGGFAGEVAQQIPPTHLYYAALVDEEAKSLIALGFTVQGVTCYQRLVEKQEECHLAEPEFADYQHDLATSYERLGSLMAVLGQVEATSDFFEKSLAIREGLTRAEPERTDYQSNLSVSYNKLGELMTTLGQGDAARNFFQKALAICERLARAEPERTDLQRALSVCYNKFGDLMADLGQGRAARVFFQRDLAIAERLARTEPERADYQHDLAASYEKLGDLMTALGQVEAARDLVQKSLAIIERLTRAEPERTDYQRDLAVSYGKLGDLMTALGQVEAARDVFQKALAIFERLARAEPERADYQRDLSVSYSKLGDLMTTVGQGEAACDFFKKALAIREGLARAEPGRADYQRDLAASYGNLGDFMTALGQVEAARDFFQKALAIFECLAQAEPERAGYQRDLSVSYDKLGDLMADLGQGEAARDFFQKSFAIRERLARAEPERADYQRNLCVSYERLGDLLRQDGNVGTAGEYFRQSLAIRGRLADAEPERADLQRDLVVPLTHLAQLEPDKAHAYLGRTLQILRTLKSAGRQVSQLDEWIAGLEEWIEHLGPAN